MLAQPMTRTKPATIVIRARNAKTGISVLAMPRNAAIPSIGKTCVAAKCSSRSGCSARSCAAMTRISAVACGSSTPGFSRPMISKRVAARSCIRDRGPARRPESRSPAAIPAASSRGTRRHHPEDLVAAAVEREHAADNRSGRRRSASATSGRSSTTTSLRGVRGSNVRPSAAGRRGAVKKFAAHRLPHHPTAAPSESESASWPIRCAVISVNDVLLARMS